VRRGRSIPGDPDARFAVTRGKSHFGYKWHLAVEDESGLGRQAELTATDFA
jgi:IS5 family transposase